MIIAAGTRLAHYEIISPLGAGGMGEVYLAYDARLDRQLAVKLLPAQFTYDAARLQRFVQEAKAASALNHPNIITIYDVGEAGGAHYIALELIAGQTLRQRLRGAPLNVNEAVEIATQIASAVAAAHSAGIVHRDLKPENVMVRPDGVVKVLDFGLAKLPQRQAKPSQPPVDTEAPTLAYQQMAGAEKVAAPAQTLTTPGMLLGTVRYMSPEQARGLTVDARTDIFSLGVVLYEMLTGHAPFEGETASDLIAAILTSEPPAHEMPDAPAELQRIVAKTLHKDRAARYQTSAELLADLKELKQELAFAAKQRRAGSEAETQQIAAPAAITSPDLILKRRWLSRRALLLLPVALLILAVIVWLVWRGRPRATFDPASLKTVEVVSWRSVPGEGYSIGAFSPDGRMIAFTSTRSGNRNVWLKPVGSGEAVQVTKDEFRNENPIWSPSGEELAFLSSRGGQTGIWRIPYTGGTPALIKTFSESSVRLRSWSKDGATIYYEAQPRFFALDLKTGQATQLTDLDTAKLKAESFSIAPDGARVAYVSVGADGRSAVWIAPVRGGAPTQIADNAGHARNTVWHPDGERVLYSANVDGVYQIFAAYVDGQPPAQLTFSETNRFALDVAADGAKILYGSSKEESDIWGVRIDDGEEFALTSDIGSEFWPAVAPDGKTIAFQSVRNMSQGDKIFNCSLLTRPVSTDGQQFELVTNAFLPQWSPDGSQLAFMRLAGERLSLWTIRATGGAEKQLIPDGLPATVRTTLLSYHRVQASDYGWSPDGSSLAYCSDSSGQRNFWVITADGANNTQVTSNSDPNLFLHCPLWSSDGTRLAYSSTPNRVADGKMSYGVWITDIEAKNSKAVFQSDSFLRLIGWSAGAADLLLATVKGKTATGSPAEVSLVRITGDTSERRPLAVLQSAYLYNIHLSADRQMIAFTAHRDGRDNIWIMPASGGAAKRLTANNDARLYFSTLSWSPDGKAIYFSKQSRHSLLSIIINPK